MKKIAINNKIEKQMEKRKSKLKIQNKSLTKIATNKQNTQTYIYISIYKYICLFPSLI